MTIDHLIDGLSSDLKPVKPLPSFGHRILAALLISAAILASGILYWFWRKGEFNLPQGRSLAEAVLLFLSFICALRFAVRSSSPHTAAVKADRIGWAFAGLWTLVMASAFVHFFFENASESLEALKYQTWVCPTVVFSMALPSAAMLYWHLRKGAVLYPRNTVISWAWASISLGLFGLAFICPWADPLHELLWHALPAALGTLTLIAISSRGLFRKLW